MSCDVLCDVSDGDSPGPAPAVHIEAFYICAKYRARSGRPEEDFVVRSARMTLTGLGRFDLAYVRHTERWFTVYRGLTAVECFEEIEGNEVFWPM